MDNLHLSMIMIRKFFKKIKRTGPYESNGLNSGSLFTGAIPLPYDAGAFACGVSTLSRFAPHYGQPGQQIGYPILPILTPCLVWTPDQHRRNANQYSHRSSIHNSQPPRNLDYRNAPPFPATNVGC